jgi:hypothetical protein
MTSTPSIVGLRGNCRGTSLIEFGLIAPLLMTMMMGVIDFGRAFTHKFAMEQAAYRTLEKITVGSLDTDYSVFKAEAALASGEPEENVRIRGWVECDNDGVQRHLDETCENQQLSRFIRVAIESDFQLSFPTGPLAHSLGHANSLGQIRLSVGSTLRVQ